MWLDSHNQHISSSDAFFHLNARTLLLRFSFTHRPREAAMTIVRIVNNRNPQVSLHALALLDTLVQQCGYAFQLQVATKEFLNELVRRFPERPPPMAGPVMLRILELIHTWRETICVDSRFKEDFGNIRDMHRLLTLKGYRFRDFPHPQQNNVASTSVSDIRLMYWRLSLH